MAGEAVVGALRVVLGMDTAQFEDGAKRLPARRRHLAPRLPRRSALWASLRPSPP
jgi:hypothetical protein